jgi:methyltransferase (TIGR00027 family)
VKDAQASRTALLIAASLVLLHHDPKYSTAVSELTAQFCARVLATYSWRTRLFSKAVRKRWFQRIGKMLEHITIPGILLHYALRKKSIGQLARAALSSGTTQVMVIGAGFDPLALSLSSEFHAARFWEMDHPATQRAKRRALLNIESERVHLLASDLSANSLDRMTLIEAGYDPARPTFWLAEGLLMYLAGAVVSSLMLALSKLSSPGSQVVFTFMERQSDGRIRFHSQTKLVDWWLRRHGEPFLWGATREELAHFVRPWRILRILDHKDLRQTDPVLAEKPVAKGELICLAEI